MINKIRRSAVDVGNGSENNRLWFILYYLILLYVVGRMSFNDIFMLYRWKINFNNFISK